MKRVAVTDQRAIGQIVPERGEEDVIVERDGRPIAVIMPFEDDDYEWYLKERDPEFIKSIERARQQVREGKVTSLEKLKEEFGIE